MGLKKGQLFLDRTCMNGLKYEKKLEWGVSFTGKFDSCKPVTIYDLKERDLKIQKVCVNINLI